MTFLNPAGLYVSPSQSGEEENALPDIYKLIDEPYCHWVCDQLAPSGLLTDLCGNVDLNGNGLAITKSFGPYVTAPFCASYAGDNFLRIGGPADTFAEASFTAFAWMKGVDGSRIGILSPIQQGGSANQANFALGAQFTSSGLLLSYNHGNPSGTGLESRTSPAVYLGASSTTLWHQVAWTRDGLTKEVKMFADGKVLDAWTYALDPYAIVGNTRLVLGQNNSSTGRGIFGCVEYHKRVFSEAEVVAHMLKRLNIAE